MRRLQRWTFHALAAGSLLLCVATAGLWVRSYWVYDEFMAERQEARSGYPHYRCFVSSYGGQFAGWLGWNDWPEGHPMRPWVFEIQHGTEGYANAWTILHRDHIEVSEWHWQGCRRCAVPHWTLVSAFTLLPSVAAFRQVRAVRRRPGRAGLGRCPACGYDLRATTERCPELPDLHLPRASVARPGVVSGLVTTGIRPPSALGGRADAALAEIPPRRRVGTHHGIPRRGHG